MENLELGHSSSGIQSLQQEHRMSNMTDLVTGVQSAFDGFPWQKLECNFLSLQACMVETLKIGGDNKYKLPHLHKERLAKEGRLVDNVVCDIAVYNAAIEKLDGVDRVAMAMVIEEEVIIQRNIEELRNLFEQAVMIGDEGHDGNFQQDLLLGF